MGLDKELAVLDQMMTALKRLLSALSGDIARKIRIFSFEVISYI